MKQIKTIKIDSPIIPDKGIGKISLGMNSFYLREIYASSFQNEKGWYSTDFDSGEWSTELWKPFFGSLNLKYESFMEITINLFNGCVSHLRVKNNYRGKVNGIAGIGDPVREYYEKNKDFFCEFIEGDFFFWIKNDFGLSLKIGDSDDTYDDGKFEKYLDMPILEIEIFDDKQRIGIGAELPENWKTKN